jgi:hypothetical protein
MALQTLSLWEIVLDAIQIGLGLLILILLIRNKIKYKQMILKAPAGEKSQNFNTEFIIEAIRQQSELAFSHILETIDKERQTLGSYFELRDTQIAPHMLQTATVPVFDQACTSETIEPNTANTIYSEIRTLSSHGMSLEDISEKLNVPRGEVELVLKLKRLSAASAKNKTTPLK